MKAAIYSLATGKIIFRTDAPADHIQIQCQEGQEFYLNCPESATDIIGGEPVTIPPTPSVPTVNELIASITRAVQRHLDTTAQSHGYDGILSLSSYAVSTDPIFAVEGAAGAAWRDTCWRLCADALAEVEAGTRAMPTPEEGVSELPPMLWPSA
jgi:hypothetical protein